MKNIVLIGMPGCGKTTIGRILAARTGRLFIDCDSILEEAAGLSIPEIFKQEGEAGFRIRETGVLQSLSIQSDLVIATGGGCVTREENYTLLKRNGIIIFVERDICQLAREGRPLSAGNLKDMYHHRLPLYRRFAGMTILNDGSADNTADKIYEQIISRNSNAILPELVI